MPNINDTIRLVAYLRDSGGTQQELSVIQQEKAVGEWAKRNDIIVTRIFKDIARSGTSTAGRDKFLEMMDYLNGRTPESGLLIWEYSRFSRDIDDLQFYLADLRRRGYSIHSMNDQIPEGLEGRLLESIIGWKNARFIEDLRRNVIRGQRYVAEIHHAWFGQVPIGYVKVQKNIGLHRDGTEHTIHYLEIDPHTAPIIKRAFEMRAQGATYSEIHQETHLFPWLQTYSKILKNEIYTGTFRNDLWTIANYCPAIIDLDLWRRVQAVNADRKEKAGYNHPRAVRSRYLLSGILHCASCGLIMNGMSLKINNSRFYYYVCIGRSKTENKCTNRYIRQDEIEPRVINALKSLLLNGKVLNDLYEEVQRQSAIQGNEQIDKLSQLNYELGKTAGSIMRLVSAIKEMGHSPSMLKSLAELEDRKSSLETEIARMDVSPRIQMLDMEKIVSYIRNELDNADSQKIAQVLRGFVVDIRAFKDEKITGEILCRLPGIDNYIIPL